MKGRTQKQLCVDRALQADSSTHFVLNVIRSRDLLAFDFDHVTANHFDIDSFLSVWAVINPRLALENFDLLCEVARLGDFRELDASPLSSSSSSSSLQLRALRMACWINSEEKRLFYEPFGAPITAEDGEMDAHPKFDYFLNEFTRVLLNADDTALAAGDEEVALVMRGLQDIESSEAYADVGVVVMHVREPGHYYALFSRSRDMDIVVSVYSGQRFEVELKYTTMVDLASRAVLPRVDLTRLVQRLNEMEKEEVLAWHADRVTDSGPLLRLETGDRRLSKGERYGHPCDRPVHASAIPAALFVRTVLSYFRFAYKNNGEQASSLWGEDFEWEQVHDFNRAIPWQQWRPPAAE